MTAAATQKTCDVRLTAKYSELYHPKAHIHDIHTKHATYVRRGLFQQMNNAEIHASHGR